MTPKNQPMNRINKTLLFGLLLCLLSAAGKGYGQEVGTVLWNFEICCGGSGSRSPVAIGKNGLVYVGTMDGEVLALNGQTGVKRWSFKCGPANDQPAIGADGTVYIASEDKKFYALDGETGNMKWAYTLPLSITNGHWSSSPAIGADGTVYIGASEGLKKDLKFFALDGQTGIKKWDSDIAPLYESSPAIGADGTVYISGDPSLHALNGQTGVKRWVFSPVDASSPSSSPAIGADGTVYVAYFGGLVYAVNGKTGVKKWSYVDDQLVDARVIRGSPVIGIDGTIYIKSHGGLIHALNGKSGAKKWVFSEKVGGYHEGQDALAIGADGTIYSGSGYKYKLNGNIIALDGQTGKKKWNLNVGDNITSSPVIGPNGIVYITAWNHGVFAIKASSGPADSPWPMFGQNAQGTGAVPTTGPIIITRQPESLIIAAENQRTTISASTEGAWPRTYQWAHNGEPIEGATEPYLTIENVTQKDAGRYRVTISNKHGSVTSDEMEFKVFPKGAPQIFADGKEVVFADGNKIIDSVVKGDKAEITLSTSFEGGAIFYTLDGSEPSFESTPYQAPFTVSKTTGVRAIAYKKDFSDLAEADPVFINIVPNYDLNVSVQGQGAVIKDPVDGPYMQDSVVKMKAIPEEGWMFKGWDGALKSSFEEGSVVMSESKTIQAKFIIIPKYDLSLETSGGGSLPDFNIDMLTLRSGFSYKMEIETNKNDTQNKLGRRIFLKYDKEKYYNELYNSTYSDLKIKFISDLGRPSIEANYNGQPLGSFYISANSPISEKDLYEGKYYLLITNEGKTRQLDVIEIEFSNEENLFIDSFKQKFKLSQIINFVAHPSNDFQFLGWIGDATGTNPELTPNNGS